MSTKIQTNNTLQTTNGFKTIFWSGLVASVLDGIAGMFFLNLWYKLSPAQFMQFIASGIYGTAAFAGGTPMVIVGIVIHFLIAFIIAIIYYYAYPKIGVIKNKPVLAGLLLGLGVWLVMNLLVMPMSNTQKSPFSPGPALISIIWHMVLVGLPIAIITKKHLDKQ
jgi:uncharacterized membrane protein YagU involved in acid resistance